MTHEVESPRNSSSRLIVHRQSYGNMTLATLCSTLQLLKHRLSMLTTRQAYAREDVIHYKVPTLTRTRCRKDTLICCNT